MRVVMFVHSLRSDWNHGNVHFLRGIVTELQRRGHTVRVYEPSNAWSAQGLADEAGLDALDAYREAYPTIDPVACDLSALDLDEALDGANLVLVHEWTDAEVISRVGRMRSRGARFQLLFHDTHHRSVTKPHEMSALDLSGFDGVLAFGAAVSREYERCGWGRRVWTWHEAADTSVFRPLDLPRSDDLVWIGNWGDDERSAELREYLLDPARELGLTGSVYGVRYPDEGRQAVADAGLSYRGYVPNHRTPALYAHHRVTVHVPRRPYTMALPGIPTIRVFEALACGLPLVSAPWQDSEGLFSAGDDFLMAASGTEMYQHLRAVLSDDGLAAHLGAHGRETVLARHTCAHRVNELEGIVSSLTSHLVEHVV
jgi:spore maturation protein CgeB